MGAFEAFESEITLLLSLQVIHLLAFLKEMKVAANFRENLGRSLFSFLLEIDRLPPPHHANIN